MVTRIVSFGFKHGPPAEGATVIDLRVGVPNPWSVPGLRDSTGLDLPVRRWFCSQGGMRGGLERVKETAERERGTLWVGCRGGRHRSVFVAQTVGDILGLPVEHRELLGMKEEYAQG